MDPNDRPNVVALPPLIYLVGLIAAFVLNAIFPLTLTLPPTVRWAGVGLMVAAIALAVAARRAFVRAGTNVNPMQPSTALVASGPFRWSRNPMYVGMTTLLVGFALTTRMTWALILLVPVLAIMHWGVVLREERYLARKFGVEYDVYRAAVRRYL
jgi:protein-S-isoprenylcysteine O-methyltransferase Ste14